MANAVTWVLIKMKSNKSASGIKGVSCACQLANLNFISDYTMKAICDDQITLWVDGVQTDGHGVWNQMSTLDIPATTQVLGIKCFSMGGAYGIMAAVQDVTGENVLVTDDSWSCSNAADDGWEKADFVEGGNWNAASYYNHGGYITDNGPWSSMSANRQIIWTDSAADTTVYCRKVLNP